MVGVGLWLDFAFHQAKIRESGGKEVKAHSLWKFKAKEIDWFIEIWGDVKEFHFCVVWKLCDAPFIMFGVIKNEMNGWCFLWFGAREKMVILHLKYWPFYFLKLSCQNELLDVNG